MTTSNTSLRLPRAGTLSLNVMPHTQGTSSMAQASDGPDLGMLLRIVRANLGSILMTMAAAIACGVVYMSLAAPAYTASSAIFIDPRNRKLVNDEVMQSGTGNDVALFESQVNIIGSDTILRRVVTALKLEHDREFAPVGQPGLLSTVREAITGPRARPDSMTQALETLARRMRVRRAQNTYVVTVDVTTDNAVKSAAIANAVLKAYQDDQAAAKSDAARRANGMIDARLDELKEQVRVAETRADEFKRANKIVTSEGGLLNEQQLTRLNTELVTIRSQVAQSKAKLDEMTATLKRGVSPEALPEAMSSPVIQKLRDQYAILSSREAALASRLQPRHPLMTDAHAQTVAIKQQIGGELQRIALQAQNEFQIATTREREILKTLNRSEDEVAVTTTAQIKLREFERESDASREVLRAFLARAKETQEQQNISIADARVITPAAVPSRPSSPNPMLVLAVSALSGLGLGLARALSSNKPLPPAPAPGGQRIVLDGDRAPLRLVGAVPRLDLKGAMGRLRGTSVSPEDVINALSDAKTGGASQFRQAIQKLTTRLRNLSRNEVPQVVLLVSATPNAGTTTSALAIAYAQALSGERTLLIDAASADPKLSTLFAGDLEQDHPCVLDSKEHLAEITSRDPRSGLSFLPIALADLRLLTMTQRTRLANGINKLAMDYDLVVVDGGAASDDKSIGALVAIASQVVVVARAGSYQDTEIHDLASALQIPAERMAGILVTMAGRKTADALR